MGGDEKLIEERADRLANGESLVRTRTIRVGVAGSREGISALPARMAISYVPPVEECEEVPAYVISKGNRLLTVPAKKSKLGRYVLVQNVLHNRVGPVLANIEIDGKAEIGVRIHMSLDPKTLVRRF
jgi:hypothetical protein